ncbi:MAG: HAD family hydrolase [Janthinobacterium lividum]
MLSSLAGTPLDLLVFDLDGTLIDSQGDLANAVNAALMELRRPTLENRQIADFIGDGAAMLLHRALEATGGSDKELAAQALDVFLTYYRAHKLDNTYVYPGVLKELQLIREWSPTLPMAVLTNKPVGPSRDICDGLGLSPFFFANYGSDSFATKKPDPLGLQTLMAQASGLLGRTVSATRTVMVGDSHVDVETAHAAGTLSLGCSYGLSPESLLQAGPYRMVSSPTDWLRTLRTML